MNSKLIIALAASAALIAPLAAQAQDASSTVTINGTVEEACVVGQPSQVALTIGDMTGPDGRITAALASAAVAQSAEITNAWCNAPSILSLDGSPMALSPVPAYSTPVGFARLVTYDATLTGWPDELADRPLVGDAAKTTAAASAHATTLLLEISALEALDAAGAAANTTAVLEAGGYAGSVVIAVSVQ